jgi:hypothetical protein
MVEPVDPFLQHIAIRRAALDVRAAQIDQRKAAIRQQEAEIRADEELLVQERAKLDEAENEYRGFLDEKVGKIVKFAPAAEIGGRSSSAAPHPRAPGREPGEMTVMWRSTIKEIVTSADHGFTHDEVKAEIRKTPLSSQLDQRTSVQKYYHAVQALHKQGEIVNHNGRVFSPTAYRKFRKDVESGIVTDDRPIAKGHYSPMGEEIVEIATKSAIGLRRYDLIAELDKNPMFSETLAKHASVFYNTVAHLIKQGRLEKVGDIYRIPPEKLRKAAE